VTIAPEWLLVGAVVGVGILHTIVPDHWVPITLIARQQRWSTGETARAALVAGFGHVTSTLVIGLIVWLAGVAFAAQFGHLVSIVSSVALIGFGCWIGIGAWREMRGGKGHTHAHGHHHASTDAGPHGPELNRLTSPAGTVELSIFENDQAPRFRLTGPESGAVFAETTRDDGSRQKFDFAHLGLFWESTSEIHEPHQFTVEVTTSSAGRNASYTTRFDEHADDDGDAEDDALYQPTSRGSVAVTHAHVHKHGNRAAHSHRHDHDQASAHVLTESVERNPPAHEHKHKTSSCTALLLILGSSPMIEGIPAFFAAGKYGLGLIAAMAVAFGISTIATYVLLCVYSTAGLQRVNLGSFEKYGEVASGAFIAIVGLVFLFVPVL
jgi:ABC-type nickel/cobalt efflux system permease component RcnA